MRTRTSSGSPSWALVLGKKPKSKGNVIPAGRLASTTKAPRSASYLSLFRLPCGDSITARSRPLSSTWGILSRLGISQALGVGRRFPLRRSASGVAHLVAVDLAAPRAARLPGRLDSVAEALEVA